MSPFSPREKKSEDTRGVSLIPREKLERGREIPPTFYEKNQGCEVYLLPLTTVRTWGEL